MKLNHFCICAPWRWFWSKHKPFDTLLVGRWSTIYINSSYPTLSSSTLIGPVAASVHVMQETSQTSQRDSVKKRMFQPVERKVHHNHVWHDSGIQHLLAFCFLLKKQIWCLRRCSMIDIWQLQWPFMICTIVFHLPSATIVASWGKDATDLKGSNRKKSMVSSEIFEMPNCWLFHLGFPRVWKPRLEGWKGGLKSAPGGWKDSCINHPQFQ